MTEYPETAEQRLLVAHGLRDTFCHGWEGNDWLFGLGGSNCNIEVKQQTDWDQVNSVLEALFLPARPPRSEKFQNLSKQCHQQGTKYSNTWTSILCWNYNKLYSRMAESEWRPSTSYGGCLYSLSLLSPASLSAGPCICWPLLIGSDLDSPPALQWTFTPATLRKRFSFKLTFNAHWPQGHLSLLFVRFHGWELDFEAEHPGQNQKTLICIPKEVS